MDNLGNESGTEAPNSSNIRDSSGLVGGVCGVAFSDDGQTDDAKLQAHVQQSVVKEQVATDSQ